MSHVPTVQNAYCVRPHTFASRLQNLDSIIFTTHKCPYCEKNEDYLSLELSFQDMTVEQADNLLLQGFSRYGRIFDVPSTFLDCCPRYRIRNVATVFKANHNAKVALADMESIASVSAPLLRLDDLPVGQVIRNRSMSNLSNNSGASPRSDATGSSVGSKSDPSLSRSSGVDPPMSSSPLKRIMTKPRSVSTNSLPVINMSASPPTEAPFLEAPPKLPLEIKIEKPSLTDDKWVLWCKYQGQWHDNGEGHDRRTKEYFQEFLVDSPIREQAYEGSSNLEGLSFGTKHVSFTLGGDLIAVIVIDILPNVMNLLYSVWDPDYANKKLGSFVLIQTIHLAKTWGIKYTDSGWYIRDSNKMRYKAAYDPVELLCPVTFKWVSLGRDVKDLMDDHGATHLASGCTESDTSRVKAAWTTRDADTLLEALGVRASNA